MKHDFLIGPQQQPPCPHCGEGSFRDLHSWLQHHCPPGTRFDYSKHPHGAEELMGKLEKNGSPEVKWTIAEALEFIRRHQPVAMEKGFYLALAGGVLNKGESINDLDLVAMPRTQNSSVQEISNYFDKVLGGAEDPSPTGGFQVAGGGFWQKYPKESVEIVFVQPN